MSVASPAARLSADDYNRYLQRAANEYRRSLVRCVICGGSLPAYDYEWKYMAGPGGLLMGPYCSNTCRHRWREDYR